MGVCIGLYIAVMIYLILRKRQKLPKVCYETTAWKIVLCMTAANTLAFILFLTGSQSGVSSITRNTYGEGNKTEALEAMLGESKIKERVSLEIQERKYTQEELKKVFEESVEKLNTLILGSNKEKEHIDHNLNLVKKIPDVPIQVEWELDRYDVMNVYGEIQQSKASEEGTRVKLRGALSYEGEEFPYLTEVIVYPPKLSKEKAATQKIKKLISEIDNTTREEPVMTLPKNIENNKITWKRRADHRGYVILLLGIAAAVSICGLKRQEEKKIKASKTKQMMRDYPEIVSKLVLLLGAGMTVRNAWKKVAADYDRQREIIGVHSAYEEMSNTLHEIQGGVTEAEGYERFGRRCGLAQYLKLGATLSQNLKKGTSGLTELLRTEAAQAFEERKNMARKMGEEASTKLLLPMFLMLAIVLVIVIVPAFLSVQL